MTDPQTTPGAEPEYLGPDTPPARTADDRADDRADDGADGRRARSRWVVGAAALGLVGAAAGGWAAAQLLGGGEIPATAVPAIAVGYVALDLDPTAAQKVEALRIAKKFPALAEQLDLGVRDDLRRWLFDERFAEVGCGLDYDDDVAPWIGDRMALAAVPGDDGAVAPLLVAQVADRDAARDTVAAIDTCARAARESIGGEEAGGRPDGPLPERSTGVAFVGDYVLVAEDQEDADAFAAAAQAAPLAEDPAFAEWMDAVGEPGVVTAYVAKDAPRLLTGTVSRMQEDLVDELPGGLAGGPGGATGSFGQAPPLGAMAEQSRELWKDFDGMAAVVRFADGALELEAVGRGLPGGVAAGTAPTLSDLPASTAAAFTFSLTDGWFEDLADGLYGVFSAGETQEEFWAGMEAGTGLDLPEDVERLLGDGLSLSVDSSLDPEVAAPGSGQLPSVPVALRIAGDTAEIRTVLDRVLALAGPVADQVVVEETEGQVTVGTDRGYVDRVLTEGGLADEEAFSAVVPEADRATSALFVGFDTAGWATRLAGDDAEARANLEPLDALGISAWRDGDLQRGLLRLTTD